MKIGICVRNYFTKIPFNYWSYNSFSNFMQILGYENIDCITRTYIRFLKKIKNEEKDDEHKIIVAESLLKEIELNKINEVISLFLINIF